MKTPTQARELFDELWRAQNPDGEEKEAEATPDNEAHFVAIKTHGPDL